jgi:hypothetical protein
MCGHRVRLAHGHSCTLSIQWLSTASSAQKSTEIFTDGDDHVKRCRNSTSTPCSLSREKPTSKAPAVVAQRDESTETIAVHFRSRAGFCISENWTSLIARIGLHAGVAAACVTPISPVAIARVQEIHSRFGVRTVFRFVPGL